MDSPELQADTNGARQTALRAHAVIVKLKEMGLPDELDADLATLSTDLGDIWHAEAVLAQQMRSLLESSQDWESVGDRLVDLRATLDHVAWHVKSARRPVSKIARYAYREVS